MKTANNRVMALVLAGVVAAFGWALYHLLMLRYESGEVYPPYSSFRADPLGTRALYEAFELVPGVEVSRNLQPFTRLGVGRDTALLICGASLSKDPKEALDAINRFVVTGGRLVVSFVPMPDKPLGFDREKELKKIVKEAKASKEEDESDAETGEEERSDGDPDEEEGSDVEPGEDRPDDDAAQTLLGQMKLVSIEDVWGFKYGFLKLTSSNDSTYDEVEALRAPEVEGLPESVSWHTALFFEELDEAWTPIYERDGRAVMMERSMGDGTIVLSSDSYFLSNEAMWEERHADLIAWLLAGRAVDEAHAAKGVVFDEFHFGIGERPGVAALARRYRLHGLITALGVMALLFVWKSLASLTPKVDEVDAAETLGMDSRAGLSNLLRRSIPPSQVLSTCYEEWRHGLLEDPKGPGKVDGQVRAVVERQKALPAKERDLLRGYREICGIIEERKRIS